MSFWYLATPYSKHEGGLEEAHRIACQFAGRLIRAGVPVYSPIAHTHPIARWSNIDPLDHSIWLPADGPMMKAAHGLLVLRIEGWQWSKGVRHEINWFEWKNRPVYYVSPLSKEADLTGLRL